MCECAGLGHRRPMLTEKSWGVLKASFHLFNGVEKISSRSTRGYGRVTLTYGVAWDMDKALVLLLSKLSAVDGLPKDADTPTVRTSNSDDSPVARLALVAKDGFDVDVESLGQYLDTNIVEPLSRVEGIAEVDYYGGSRREIRVLIHPDKLVQYKITLGELIEALRTSSSMMSVGMITEGKRSYTVRSEAVNYTRILQGGLSCGLMYRPREQLYRCCLKMLLI